MSSLINLGVMFQGDAFERGEEIPKQVKWVASLLDIMAHIGDTHIHTDMPTYKVAQYKKDVLIGTIDKLDPRYQIDIHLPPDKSFD